MKSSFLNKIEHLFEPEIIQENFPFLSEKKKNAFEYESNFKLLENAGYFKQADDNWDIYFSRLAPFFDFGILFHKNKLKTTIHHGEVYDCSSSEINLKLPQSKPFNIFSTNAKYFLKKIKLDIFFDADKLSCHFVRLNEETCFVLFSQRAEPWNKLLIESLQKSVINYSL